MLSRRKPIAALAAIAVTAAISVPAATASAATTDAPAVDPTVCQLTNLAAGPFGPGMFIGGTSLRNTLLAAGASVGCAPPPAQASPLPLGPLPLGP
ncbi:MAG TPA: hypothetical protein VE570_15400 [Thermoleophilaceae bacterium]|nr:hypothetical protein [Thermoleophilaceae bacterium]